MNIEFTVITENFDGPRMEYVHDGRVLLPRRVSDAIWYLTGGTGSIIKPGNLCVNPSLVRIRVNGADFELRKPLDWRNSRSNWGIPRRTLRDIGFHVDSPSLSDIDSLFQTNYSVAARLAEIYPKPFFDTEVDPFSFFYDPVRWSRDYYESDIGKPTYMNFLRGEFLRSLPNRDKNRIRNLVTILDRAVYTPGRILGLTDVNHDDVEWCVRHGLQKTLILDYSS